MSSEKSDTKPVFENVEQHDGWVSHPIKANLREEWYKQELSTLTEEVKAWLEKSTNQKIDGDLFDALVDGKILCDAVQEYYPRAHEVQNTHRHAIGFGDQGSYTYMENITFFRDFLQHKLNLPEDILFDTDDLYSYHKHSEPDVAKRNVLLSISLFAGYLDAHGATEWDKHRGQFTVNEADQMHFSIRKGDTDAVKAQLVRQKSADHDVQSNVKQALSRQRMLSRHGWTSMYSAAWYDRGIVIDVLLAEGHDPNESIPAGFFPMHAAAYRGAMRALEALKAGKATVDVYNFDGTTPLFSAAVGDRASATSHLLERGADVDGRRNDEAPTPLVGAVHRCRLSRMMQLVRAGADVNVKFNSKQYSILHLAVINERRSSRYPSMVGPVLNLANLDLNAVTNAGKGSTALMLAAIHGCRSAAELLIAAGADAKHKNPQDHDALALAVRNGHQHTARAIAKPLNVDVPNLPEVHTRTHPMKAMREPPAPAGGIEALNKESKN